MKNKAKIPPVIPPLESLSRSIVKGRETLLKDHDISGIWVNIFKNLSLMTSHIHYLLKNYRPDKSANRQRTDKPKINHNSASIL
jgi:hypothetical protein